MAKPLLVDWAFHLPNYFMGRYETGMDPYLNVLTAQTTVLSDEHPGGIANSANGLDSEPGRGAGRWMGPLATFHAVASNTQIPRLPITNCSISLTASLLEKVPKWRARHAPAKEFSRGNSSSIRLRNKWCQLDKRRYENLATNDVPLKLLSF